MRATSWDSHGCWGLPALVRFGVLPVLDPVVGEKLSSITTACSCVRASPLLLSSTIRIDSRLLPAKGARSLSRLKRGYTQRSEIGRPNICSTGRTHQPDAVNLGIMITSLHSSKSLQPRSPVKCGCRSPGPPIEQKSPGGKAESVCQHIAPLDAGMRPACAGGPSHDSRLDRHAPPPSPTSSPGDPERTPVLIDNACRSSYISFTLQIPSLASTGI